MLPAKLRLTRRDDFALAIRRGRRVSAPGIVLHAHPGTGSGTPRIGFIVNRAVGNAVERNEVRRRLRHLVAARTEAIAPGARLVVRATPSAGTASFQALADSVAVALAKAATGMDA